MTYYQKYSATREASVFSFSFLRGCCSRSRSNRRASRLANKALPNTVDAKEWGQGAPCSWFTGPPSKPSFYN